MQKFSEFREIETLNRNHCNRCKLHYFALSKNIISEFDIQMRFNRVSKTFYTLIFENVNLNMKNTSD